MCYFPDALNPCERLMLVLKERPVGFNFGCGDLILAINQVGAINIAAA